MTNYEKIKIMTVKEMAEWYATADACKYCDFYCHARGTCYCFESNKTINECCIAAAIKMIESEVE